MKKTLLIDPCHDSINHFRVKIMPAMPFPSQLTVATKTATAIDLLGNNVFDILISHVMPSEIVNGLHIVARLRNGDFGHENMGIFAIAYAPVGFDVTSSIDAGFDIQTPPTDDILPLIQIMRQYLHNSRAKAPV